MTTKNDFEELFGVDSQEADSILHILAEIKVDAKGASEDYIKAILNHPWPNEKMKNHALFVAGGCLGIDIQKIKFFTKINRIIIVLFLPLCINVILTLFYPNYPQFLSGCIDGMGLIPVIFMITGLFK